jgi:hypothetical protein
MISIANGKTLEPEELAGRCVARIKRRLRDAKEERPADAKVMAAHERRKERVTVAEEYPQQKRVS